MLLFVNTATTGPWLFNQPPDHADQPRLIQVAAQLLNPDGTFTQEINSQISANNQRATHFEKSLQQIAWTVRDLVWMAHDTSGKMIAYNMNFVWNVLMKAFSESKVSTKLLQGIPRFCIMEALAERMGNRHPTLDEAWLYTFPRSPSLGSERPRIMGDVLTCRDIYFEGRDRGWWND